VELILVYCDASCMHNAQFVYAVCQNITCGCLHCFTFRPISGHRFCPKTETNVGPFCWGVWHVTVKGPCVTSLGLIWLGVRKLPTNLFESKACKLCTRSCCQRTLKGSNKMQIGLMRNVSYDFYSFWCLLLADSLVAKLYLFLNFLLTAMR